ncbi:MAG TPA: hypothetical protein VFT56_12015 [Sphingomonas sp.]|nr:hypothetical protein [Sphingomonas sp.]
MATSPSSPDLAAEFAPVRLKPRHDGWTAERQRQFIETLAERGCISDACEAVGLTPKSAYRLRRHPDGAAFAEAWDRALAVATGRLVAIAFDRAIKGGTREVWKDGICVAEFRAPSDRLLMFLLSRLDARRFGSLAGLGLSAEDPLVAARAALPGLIDRLIDTACPAEPLGLSDYSPDPLHDGTAFAREGE